MPVTRIPRTLCRTMPVALLAATLVTVLLAALGLRTVRADGPERPLLLRLADADDAAHGKAIEEWSALSPVDQVARLREGLRSGDPAVALVAAKASDPAFLSLSEIHGQMAILSKQPEWIRVWGKKAYDWIPAGNPSPGAPDIPGIWQTLAALRDSVPARDALEELHRAILPEHVPALVPLLESAGADVFSALLWNLDVVADHIGDDTHRALLAKAYLYALARSSAEKDGKARPKLEAIEPKMSGPGLPPAFVTLARAAWGLDEKALASPPALWMRQWSRSLEPSKDDVAFLAEVALQEKTPIESRAWAIRWLATFDVEAAKKALAELAGSRDEAAIFAAAEFARRGRPERFRELLPSKVDAKGRGPLLEWSVDPATARARWLEALRAAVDPNELLDLRRLERAVYEQSFDVRIRDEDLAWIGAELTKGEAAPRGAAWFFTEVFPDGLTSAVLAKVLARLRTWADLRDDAAGIDASEIEKTLALIEVRDPEALRALLRRWASGMKEGSKSRVLQFLARIGDAQFAGDMGQTWRDWTANEWVLGRVRDPRVESLLREQAESKDAGTSVPALGALAIAHGLPESLRHPFDAPKDWSADDLAEARRLVLAGDAAGAAVRLAEAGSVGLEGLGLVKDPRALALLEKMREQRISDVNAAPTYWPATAGLAIAGDADAKKEVEEFLRDGRTWMLDPHQELIVLHARSNPEWADFWVKRLGTNCCTSFLAFVVLEALYPTMPIEHEASDGGRARAAAEAFLARHKGGFVWSRILDGFVPSR